MNSLNETEGHVWLIWFSYVLFPPVPLFINYILLFLIWWIYTCNVLFI